MPRPKKVASVPTPVKPEPIPEPVKAVRLTKRNHHESRPAPPAPEPPNPHVLEIQSQIVRLVTMREQLQDNLTQAQSDAQLASVRAQSAAEALQRVEREVNYRLDLVNKMTGKPSPQFVHISEISEYSAPPELGERGLFAVHATVPAMPSGIASMGSIPASRPMVGGGPEGNVRMDSAEDIRRSL